MVLPDTLEGYMKLSDLDRTFQGTSDYMGLTYFWNYEYRHYLRDANCTKRKLTHDRLLRAGLGLVDKSPEHLSIIQKTTMISSGTHRLSTRSNAPPAEMSPR